MRHINLKIETYTQDILLPSAEIIVNHSTPILTNQIISEVYGLAENIDESLDFDTADRANYTEENSAKTDFISDKIQLKEILQVPTPYAWYHFNENTGGVIQDSSGNHRTGILTYPDWVPGKLNSANRFYTNTCASLGDIANFEKTQAFTIETWFRTSNGTSNKVIASRMINASPYCGWHVSMYSGISFMLRDITGKTLSADFGSGYGDGNWHHLVMSYDGSVTVAGIKCYVDNVLLVVGTSTNTITGSILNTAICSIGSRAGSAWWFLGDIDELVIYDSALNASQVNFRYNGGVGTEILGIYDLTKGWYVRTGSNQINTSSWNSILQIDPIETLPTNTQIRYLISVDNKVTWKKFNGISWDIVALADIDTQGNTATEIIVLLKANWELLFVAGTLDIVASLKSTFATSTPLLDEIKICYNLGEGEKLENNRILVTKISPTQLKIKNINSEPIYDISITMMIP